LPKGKAVFAGIVMKSSVTGNTITFFQPTGIFVYNNRQVNIPIKSVYYNGQIRDFGRGIDAIVQIIPKVDQNGQQVSIDSLGAAIYLSPMVSKSLFAQLYLMDDVYGKYGTVKLAHSEGDLIIEDLNSQGANIGDFAFYNGFRGPIKIWKVEYPSNILSKEEFLRTSGGYAEFDDLSFSN
jgi:hypothetical protein